MNKLKIKKKKKYFYKDNKFLKKITNEKFLNNTFFDSISLYKRNNSNIIEYNNIENIIIPLNKIQIFTIKNKLNNVLLLDFKINYNIIYNFNKYMFTINKKNIKGRFLISSTQVLNKEFLKFYIMFLGFCFFFDHNSLYKFLFYNKDSQNKKKYYKKKYQKLKIMQKEFHLNYLKIKKIKIKIKKKKKKITNTFFLLETIFYKNIFKKKYKKFII